MQGVKYDQDKPRYDLLPYNALHEVVKVLTAGLVKYKQDNWKKVTMARRRYYAAAMRHTTAWFMGERLDPETGLHHIAHAVCCLLFLLWFELKKGGKA